jgi:hypothetical protein
MNKLRKYLRWGLNPIIFWVSSSFHSPVQISRGIGQTAPLVNVGKLARQLSGSSVLFIILRS